MPLWLFIKIYSNDKKSNQLMKMKSCAFPNERENNKIQKEQTTEIKISIKRQFKEYEVGIC